MKGFVLTSFDAPPALADDLPRPTLRDHEVLVRVNGSSVNGVDAAIAAGVLKEMVEHEFPVTLGRDYAGVVEQVGLAVSRYSPGDEVYGFLMHANPTVRHGSWAEYLVVSEDVSIGPKPAQVDFHTAGAAPLAGITALAAVDALDLSEGDTALVIGATGGVGSVFVQLAAAAGANVIAPALPEDHEYLRGLGVTAIIDRNADIAAQIRSSHPDGVDALLDLVSFTPDASVLKQAGRLASPLGAAGEGPGRSNLMASPSTSNLERLGALLDAGDVRVHIQERFDLERAGEALKAFGETHTKGKLGVTLA